MVSSLFHNIANVMFLTLLQVTSSNWSDSERRTHGHQVRGPVAVYKFQKLWNKLETMIRDPDDISESILNQYHPAVLTEKYPAETTGDGNCFYRAVSRAFTGTECAYLLLSVHSFGDSQLPHFLRLRSQEVCRFLNTALNAYIASCPHTHRF
jgi:hypothetical protein